MKNQDIINKLKQIQEQYPAIWGAVSLLSCDNRYITAPGWICGSYAVHQELESDTYAVSHIATGYRITGGYKDARAALLGVALVRYTANTHGGHDPFDLPVLDPSIKGIRRHAAKIARTKTAKAIHAFLFCHVRIWDNTPLERAVGVFCRDRARCERLRHKINPLCPVEYLDPDAYDETMIGDLLMGSLRA